MLDILMNIDWSPFWISLKTGIAATAIAFVLGILFAALVMRISGKLQWLIDAVLTLPLVLPPTVAGFFLLIIFSIRRPFGAFLLDTFDIKIVQTWKGCVIAAVVIAFPLMYRNTRAAFEQVDLTLIQAGRTLGLGELTILIKIILPNAAPGIISGTMLAFTRAIGEYGATAMLAGNILGKTRTVSMAIATETANGHYDVAGVWVIIIVVLSFLIMTISNRFFESKRTHVGKW